MEKRFLSYSVLIVVLTTFFGCSKEDWSSDYDVKLPIPVVSSFNPGSAKVGETITLTGTTLSNVSNVWINDQSAQILSQSETQIQIKIGVGSKTGKIKVRNVYRQVGFAPNDINVIP
ncbi:MAG: IPT/TIG domain-containing protein [Sphingobacteriaceae bacterium]|nr:IPT/TIG domain-containing protein [Sphingobacteriaceae bacterium]